MINVFAIPIFFICLRETLETSIIVSILLAFLKQTLGHDRDATIYKRLKAQVNFLCKILRYQIALTDRVKVWMGTVLGLVLCVIIGGGLIGAFYGLGKDRWAGTENIWEGSFSIFASIIISIVGAALLRVSKLQSKWRVKLAKALEAKNSTQRTGTLRTRFKVWCETYAMFILPFITVLREGLEAVVFIGGVSLSLPASSIPLPVVCGLACGALVGYMIFRGGNFASIQVFLIISTCFLYLVAAGLFSKAVWDFENHTWNQIVGGDAAEVGTGPGSYDIRKSVWHVNCCSPLIHGGGGWGIFSGILGWQNSATYGSVISYNLYWVVIVLAFLAMRYNERNGHWPLIKAKPALPDDRVSDSSSDEAIKATLLGKAADTTGTLTNVHSLGVHSSARLHGNT